SNRKLGARRGQTYHSYTRTILRGRRNVIDASRALARIRWPRNIAWAIDFGSFAVIHRDCEGATGDCHAARISGGARDGGCANREERPAIRRADNGQPSAITARGGRKIVDDRAALSSILACDHVSHAGDLT